MMKDDDDDDDDDSSDDSDDYCYRNITWAHRFADRIRKQMDAVLCK